MVTLTLLKSVKQHCSMIRLHAKRASTPHLTRSAEDKETALFLVMFPLVFTHDFTQSRKSWMTLAQGICSAYVRQAQRKAQITIPLYILNPIQNIKKKKQTISRQQRCCCAGTPLRAGPRTKGPSCPQAPICTLDPCTAGERCPLVPKRLSLL